jgi:hypothetical protein
MQWHAIHKHYNADQGNSIGMRVYMTFEVLIAVGMKIVMVWDVTVYVVDRY